MQVKLRVMQGAHAGREVAVSIAEFMIGRGEECHLRPRSDAISRRHCVILVGEKEVVIRDLGSKNGTLVNGQPVDGECVVQPGDQLQVGPLQFQIVVAHALGGTKRPAARDVKEVAARTAASAADDVDDIARWLEDDFDSQESRDVATPETRQFRLDETSNVALDTQVGRDDEVTTTTGDEEAAEAAEESPEESDGKSGTRWKKDAPGKLPPKASTSSIDSREAAADMLKRFFNRR